MNGFYNNVLIFLIFLAFHLQMKYDSLGRKKEIKNRVS